MTVPTLLACTASVEETRALGAALAELTRPGDVVVLTGELGAGKTALTQGFARGLGVEQPVTSPTFTLVHEYRGRLKVHHLDVYRLERVGEVADLALAELLDDGGVTVVEWGDAVRAALPADYVEIALSFGEGDDDRRLLVRAVGPRWAARWVTLSRTLEAWPC